MPSEVRAVGRPLKEGLDYFPHDTDAVNDEKIEAMRALFGAEGYAFFFISLERIYRTKNGQLDIGNKERRAFLAGRIGVTDDRFIEMLNASFEVGLFDRKAFESKGLMTSKGIKRRTQQVNKERERKRYKKPTVLQAGKTEGSSKVLDGDNHGESAQRKEKQSKEKKSKGGVGEMPSASAPTRKKYPPPATVEEVSAYCREKGYHVDPELFVAHYEANGWKQGRGKPVVNWRAAVLTWEKRDKAAGKIQEEPDEYK